jgi:hypothetical protein
MLDGSWTFGASDSGRQGHGMAVCCETMNMNNKTTMIYCRDSITLVGPLGPLHARIHYSNVAVQ